MSLTFIAIALLFLSVNTAGAQPIQMTIGQTGINPGTGPFIIAQRENFFAKHGLEVKIIETQTAAAVPAMLGGSMQFTMGAGAAFTTATLEGAAPDVAMRFGLSKLGVDPVKDVKFVQMGRPDWANVIAQLEKGDVQFSVWPPPFDRIAETRGIDKLYALPDWGIQWQQNGEWVLKSYLASNRDAIIRIERALAEAMKFYFTQKDKTIGYLVNFLGTSREDTEYSYNVYAKWADNNPRPRLDAIKTTLQAISRMTPAALKADPAAFIDTSIFDQLLKEGHFKF